MAQRAKSQGWDYHELKTGHDAMITVPVNWYNYCKHWSKNNNDSFFKCVSLAQIYF
jgi:hypothetical protein